MYKAPVMCQMETDYQGGEDSNRLTMYDEEKHHTALWPRGWDGGGPGCPSLVPPLSNILHEPLWRDWGREAEMEASRQNLAISARQDGKSAASSWALVRVRVELQGRQITSFPLRVSPSPLKMTNQNETAVTFRVPAGKCHF